MHFITPPVKVCSICDGQFHYTCPRLSFRLCSGTRTWDRGCDQPPVCALPAPDLVAPAAFCVWRVSSCLFPSATVFHGSVCLLSLNDMTSSVR
ncbi:hypothetical protein HBI56_147100 [Parastagonospora nodorum]|uniref:HIT-type domain-containing protein n=1 Tax=Phaeosphaeria nodorum (strain SN15 / ATCC MYA-4574 / FGSC 10173) TaxID=321614 RepID=A0A7U2IBS7_PHANO|nr:hypothetical protein HBH56_077750 [Parastagonospora nodorum]QRD06969.1 hypothetical protein JI435_423870 [Parastagonospora nodorum SN15]KAH3923520.1 hypothetical protein HBH54_210210 [Parastagonospora nodorum]KAH3952291.1 hypothetical protein HBH53_050380 [Parastagonospora nodorum]KAH3981964.1 hypothetical protein HBH51_044650 [Parastagonospora nodorum]